MPLILSLALVIGAALLFNAAYPARGRIANLLALACLVYGQIVLVSQVLSELTAVHAAGYGIAHGVLFGLALACWWRRGKPGVVRQWRFSLAESRAAIRQNRLLTAFARLLS